MKVRVRLIGRLTQVLGFGEKDLEFKAPPTAERLIARLGLAGVDHVITREGAPLSPADRLRDGDRVVVAPIFSGG